MHNLGPYSQNSGDQRPHQKGKARGLKNYLPVEEPIEWMFDTGAELSAVTKDTAGKFDLKSTGASASGTTGGGGMIIKTGLTIVFSVLDAGGAAKEVLCSLRVAVKPNNAGSEIVGMDQIAHLNLKIQWDPQAQTGSLYE